MSQLKRSSVVPEYIIGFHGCTETNSKKIIKSSFIPSENDYDWLGRGVYFWEGNFQMAFDWIEGEIARKKLKHEKPAVIGAVIRVTSNWVDLLDTSHVNLLSAASSFVDTAKYYLAFMGKKQPTNSAYLHKLDCIVIEKMVSDLSSQNIVVDGIRGAFTEGAPIYDTANFFKKTHVQIAVRNQACIVEKFILTPARLKEICDTYNYIL